MAVGQVEQQSCKTDCKETEGQDINQAGCGRPKLKGWRRQRQRRASVVAEKANKVWL